MGESFGYSQCKGLFTSDSGLFYLGDSVALVTACTPWAEPQNILKKATLSATQPKIIVFFGSSFSLFLKNLQELESNNNNIIK